VADRNGVPLAAVLTGANVQDCTVLEELVDTIEPIKHPKGRPRKRPKKLHANKAYDTKKCREALRGRRIKARIARKGKESSERLGRHRWVVERTVAWLAKCRRLTIRYERRDDIQEAFLHLGCSLICLRLFADLPQLPRVKVLQTSLSYPPVHPPGRALTFGKAQKRTLYSERCAEVLGSGAHLGPTKESQRSDRPHAADRRRAGLSYSALTVHRFSRVFAAQRPGMRAPGELREPDDRLLGGVGHRDVAVYVWSAV
jgi:transposase